MTRSSSSARRIIFVFSLTLVASCGDNEGGGESVAPIIDPLAVYSISGAAAVDDALFNGDTLHLVVAGKLMRVSGARPVLIEAPERAIFHDIALDASGHLVGCYRRDGEGFVARRGDDEQWQSDLAGDFHEAPERPEDCDLYCVYRGLERCEVSTDEGGDLIAVFIQRVSSGDSGDYRLGWFWSESLGLAPAGEGISSDPDADDLGLCGCGLSS